MPASQLITWSVDYDDCNYANTLVGNTGSSMPVRLTYKRYIAWDESYTAQPNSELSTYTFSINNSTLITNPKSSSCPITEYRFNGV